MNNFIAFREKSRSRNTLYYHYLLAKTKQNKKKLKRNNHVRVTASVSDKAI